MSGLWPIGYLTELDELARGQALRNTGVLLTFNPSKELRPDEATLLDGARLIQFMIGGVEFIPLSERPAKLEEWYQAGEGADFIGAMIGATIVLAVWGRSHLAPFCCKRKQRHEPFAKREL
jgi:hypothetical protein